MKKDIATQKEVLAKADPLDTQKRKLVEAYQFKVIREQTLEELKKKFDALTEEGKKIQAQFNENTVQKRDAEVVIETIAGLLRDFAVDPQKVLDEAFAPIPDQGPVPGTDVVEEMEVDPVG